MVYLVIPAYNEERNLSILVYNINKVLKQTEKKFSIIIVDDGSTDQTRDIALKLAKHIPIEVLSHKENLGAGAFFNTGFRRAIELAAPGDTIVFMEADCTNDPALLPQMIEGIEQGYGIVIASRYAKGGGYCGFSIKRLILSLGANFLMRIFFPIHGIKDYTIFYRAYSYEILKKGFDVYGDRFMNHKSFLVNSEILVNLREFNIKATEVPLLYRYELRKSKSHIAIGKTLSEYLMFIIYTICTRFSKNG